MYSDLLERAVKALKEGKIPDLDAPRDRGAEINLHIPALLPSDFLPDVHDRLVLYKRISACADEDALRELKIEVIDRFGLLPEPAQNLFLVAELKLQATILGVKKLELSARGGRLLFKPKPNIDPMAVIKLVQTDAKHFAFEGQDKLKLRHTLEDGAQRLRVVQQLLGKLALRA